MEKFIDLGLSNQLVDSISKQGFDTPTEIQKKSIPIILERKDVIAESFTGSGKTLAFGCGIIEQVQPGKGLQALVLTPTRELAEQVKQSLWDLAVGKQIKIMAVYGGVSIKPQITKLPKTEVVIATPGRFLDHLARRTVNTSKIKVIVLDEADCMLDMGFIEDVQKIMESCPHNRHTMMFTATVSPRLRKLAQNQLKKPQEVFVGNHVDPKKLKQEYYRISNKSKISLLLHLFKEEPSSLAIVFCNTRRKTDYVAKNLNKNNIEAIAIHGGLSQNRRLKNIKAFEDNRFRILVCTDVASRGIHIDNVSHIYNYDIPGDSTDYVHRIGRTARAGEEGKVVNLLSPDERAEFTNILRSKKQFSIKCIENPPFKSVELVGNPGRSRPGRSRPGRNNFKRGNNKFKRGNNFKRGKKNFKQGGSAPKGHRGRTRAGSNRGFRGNKRSHGNR